ncbi:hypothetical protein ZWY2020_055678 [Hordeum vulgare]|nr:hypothetical protein ZWY2020_055678 [Hordeum vulgare]
MELRPGELAEEKAVRSSFARSWDREENQVPEGRSRARRRRSWPIRDGTWRTQVPGAESKDALRWEQDQIDTPSCYTMDVTPSPLQDEAEEIEEAEETESTKSDREEIEMEDKIVGTDGKLKLPLNVYGIVAAEMPWTTTPCNILFSAKENCKSHSRGIYAPYHIFLLIHPFLPACDPFLRLTGPSRAIVAVDHVDFEVQLKVKGSSRTPWPFKYGGRIMCSSPPQEVTDSLARQVVLVDSHRSDDGGEMPMSSDGYLDLSRHVVSVELEESLQFVIQAYSQSGDAIARQGSVKFRTKYCNISQAICEIGDSKVEITVAWSQLLKNKGTFSFEGHV